MASVILAAQAVDYDYPGGIQALRGVTLEVVQGTTLAILGPNGCGKTTLFLHLNGTLKPRHGAIMVDGRPVAYDRKGLMAWRSRIGLVLQDPDDQLFAATVRQDVSFGPLNLGLPAGEVEWRVAAALEVLGITHLADRPTHRLSFGQKRRVAIAGLLAMRPAVLVLDEPMAGLDAEGIEHLLKALDQLRRTGTTVVFSTHDIDLAYQWADRVAVLEGGRLLRHGATAEVLADRAVLAAARLRMPVVLETALRLREAGWAWTGGPPRSREALFAMIDKVRA